jgi:hypothetical protein
VQKAPEFMFRGLFERFAGLLKIRLIVLKSVGHWIGDIHQLLHVSFEDDRCNNIRVNGRCAGNLHATWDELEDMRIDSRRTTTPKNSCHEAPAPIAPGAQPATDRQPRKTARAVTTRGAGPRSRRSAFGLMR